MPIISNDTSTPSTPRFDFHLPDALQCGLPTEVRGIARDEVRLMVSNIYTDEIHHSQFKQLDDFLRAGDVLAVNTSGTLKAALEVRDSDGQTFRVHLSTKIRDNRWIIELRQVGKQGNERLHAPLQGQQLTLTTGGKIQILEAYYDPQSPKSHLQLWIADFDLPLSMDQYLTQFGQPIRYHYLKEVYPSSYYQTVFARELGSAEMPSAGRAFTPQLVSRLVSKGIQIAPILLHTGVASLEIDEKPYEEYYRVSALTAQLLNQARKDNRRIIAVGTTVVRTLESVTDRFGFSEPGEGWTDVYITPQRGIFAADGLITGFHEPKASHLLMLEALAGRNHLKQTYQSAIEAGYQWHEFGDLHLMLGH
ncbi:MAG: S-adenosylmethionine:tRNA ribosyltransferase-isomerase [Bacteroidota bacterium]